MNCTIFSVTLIILFEFAKSSFSQGFITTKYNERENNVSLYKANSRTLNKKLLNATQRKKRLSTSTEFKLNKRWQIERVANKQYEFINLLWQKTKLFVDFDYSNLTCRATTLEITPEMQKEATSTSLTSEQKNYQFSFIPAKLQTSTPSSIEFYYLEQPDFRQKHKLIPISSVHKRNNYNKTKDDKSETKKLPHQHIIASKRVELVHKDGDSNVSRTTVNKSKTNNFIDNSQLISNIKLNHNKHSKKFIQQDINTCFDNLLTKENENKTVTSKTNVSSNLHPNRFVKSTIYTNKSLQMSSSMHTITAYDKIKFFEMYDSLTPKWQNYYQNTASNIDNEPRNVHENNQIRLEHVNDPTGHIRNKTRFVKKHIQDLNDKDMEMENFTYFTKHDTKNSLKPTGNVPFQKYSSGSRLAVWSEFPFVAAYIYEPSEVRCDAASISPHWLLAAASCLSRHHKELHGGSESAFVAFCTDNWRSPTCISYVRRIFIHPRYHTVDRTRRHLFNAGVIQVVNSMSDTCNGWAPVSLMSHHFNAEQEGSIATAVGWGLDRYDKGYTIAEIPRQPLMKYEALVYSETCPGSYEYSKAKTFDEDGIRNVYCLSLPPYLAEENDTVHGALLLIGGKLLALYLQEERRPWGVQTAQYVGVWRLLPWITDTATEPVDLYALQFDSLI